MGALKGLVAGLLFSIPAVAVSAAAGDRLAGPERERPVGRWGGPVREASERFGIPEQWIGRVMRAESGGRTTARGKPITSPAGAIGLMQLMPGTWAEMRSRHGLGSDPHDPRDNILAGTAYLRAMYDRFGYPGLFAAYNAGPRRYSRHLADGLPLPAETLSYVKAVTGRLRGSTPGSRQPWPSGGVFVALAGSGAGGTGASPSPAACCGPFIPLGTMFPEAR